MATRIATPTANAVVNAVAALMNGGSVKIYTGSPPATGDDTATGTLLATFTLQNPAFASASGGIGAVDVTPPLNATAVADGTAGWFRALTSGGAKVLDGLCTATGGGGDMTLTNVAVVNGQSLGITSWSLEMPGA